MPGMHGSYAANMAMTNCDLLIALGVRFDDRVTGRLAAFAPHAKVIHVDIDPAEIGKNRAPDVPIVGDVKRVLAKLNKLLRGRLPQRPTKSSPPRAAPGGTRSAQWKAGASAATRHHRDTEIKPQHLMAEIDRLSGGQAIVTSDVGQHQMWAAQLIRFNEPRLWINSGGLGSMGFGLPAAIGAQFARPDKLVFAIVGDGGFQMSIPELATIASYGLPIKIIVMNNGYLGMVRQWQTLFYNNRLSAVELDCFPRRRKAGRRYGFKGRTIDKPWELAPALEEAVHEPGPVPAQREGHAVRMRVSHGAGRRRHQRNGAGAAATGGGAGEISEVTIMLQVISLLLENKPGALMRVTGLLSQRGYNIESLTVARTLDPELSRMTIVVDVDAALRQQVIKQMNKLINVLQATDLTESPGGGPRAGAGAHPHRAGDRAPRC